MRELEVFYYEEHKKHGRVIVETDRIEELIRIHVRDRCDIAREIELDIEWGASDSLTSCEVTWSQHSGLPKNTKEIL